MTTVTAPAVPIPLLDLKKQYATIREEILRATAEVYESQYFILGPRVEAFEKAVASYVGVRHAVGMSSGTDAQLAVMMALGVGPGDEVVMPQPSFQMYEIETRAAGADSTRLTRAQIAELIDRFEPALMWGDGHWGHPGQPPLCTGVPPSRSGLSAAKRGRVPDPAGDPRSPLGSPPRPAAFPVKAGRERATHPGSAWYWVCRPGQLFGRRLVNRYGSRDSAFERFDRSTSPGHRRGSKIRHEREVSPCCGQS